MDIVELELLDNQDLSRSYNDSLLTNNNESLLSTNIIKNIVPLSYNNETDTSNIKNIILIHDQVYDYNKFVQSVSLDSYPIVYNSNSSLEELQKLLKDKFLSINRIAFVFHDAGINQLKEFIDDKAFFTNEDLEDVVEKYSNNLQYLVVHIQ